MVYKSASLLCSLFNTKYRVLRGCTAILVRLLIAMGGKLSYPQVELKDKVAIVTGANTGIGYETAKALAIMGAHTIIACRSEERGQQVSLPVLICMYFCS